MMECMSDEMYERGIVQVNASRLKDLCTKATQLKYPLMRKASSAALFPGFTKLQAAVSLRLLSMLERHTPSLVKSVEIQLLLNTTARGFGVRGKRVWMHHPDIALQEYAGFTTECMRACDGLSKAAYRTGRIVRAVTGFRRSADCERLVFYLYKNIGINMSGKLPGEITVTDCYFSRYYTPANCALMSLVDSGVIAGICGGGSLEFYERITEGCGHCKARFRYIEKGGSET